MLHCQWTLSLFLLLSRWIKNNFWQVYIFTNERNKQYNQQISMSRYSTQKTSIAFSCEHYWMQNLLHLRPSSSQKEDTVSCSECPQSLCWASKWIYPTSGSHCQPMDPPNLPFQLKAAHPASLFHSGSNKFDFPLLAMLKISSFFGQA